MIFDRELTLCDLEKSGSLIYGELKPVRRLYYSRGEVYHRRYWEAVQAGSRIDLMAFCRRLPDDDIKAHQYALVGNHIYRVEQAQEISDPDDGLPLWLLSLRREETNYDVGRIIPKA